MDPITQPPKIRKQKALRIALIALAFIVLSIAANALYNGISGYGFFGYGGSDGSSGTGSYGYDAPGCTIAGVTIRGDLLTYIPNTDLSDPSQSGNPYGTQSVLADETSSEDVADRIAEADSDPNITGILVEIDSYGGLPVAGEEMANALKHASKPVAAVIRSGGASAAYWAATGADRIFASANSDVGSIGATMSYVQTSDPNSQYIQLSTGKFKDSGDPAKPITPEERQLFLRDLTIIKNNFIDAVAANRAAAGRSDLTRDKVAALADGSTVLGAKAKELGLIDEIGGEQSAIDWLKQQGGEQVSGDPSVCW